MIQLDFLDQQPQANGYWLLRYQRTDTHPFTLPLDFQLHLSPHYNARLLSQPNRTSDFHANDDAINALGAQTVQFLTNTPLTNPQNLTFCATQAKTHQPTTISAKKQSASEQKSPESPALPPVLNQFTPHERQQTALKQTFSPQIETQTPLILVAKGLHIATAIQLVQRFRNLIDFIVLTECDENGHFPFQPKPAQIWHPELNTLAPEAIGALPLLEDWQIPNRLCHPNGQPGCYAGTCEQLLKYWHPAYPVLFL